MGRRYAAGVIIGVTLSGVGVALAALPATGSPAGIDLARAVQRAYRHVHVQSYTERGFVWMAAVEGKSSSFTWAYGEGPLRGMFPATEHAVVVMHSGVVSWWRDDLAAATCAPGTCATVPVELVANATGLFFAFGGAASHTCFARLRGSNPYAPGKPAWNVGGHYGSPVADGSTDKLNSSYPWSIAGTAAPLTATEADTIETHSDRLLASRITVAAHFSASATYRYPAAVPNAPRINRCK